MISLTSKLTMDSKLLPGARVHLRKFNVSNRAQITLGLAEYREKTNAIYARMLETVIVPDETDETGAVTKPGDPPDVREQKAIKRVGMNTELQALEDAYIKPAVLRAYVVSVEGAEIDGEPLTAENVVTKAPPELADEIYAFLGANNGLPPFGVSNSPSPSPSPTPTDGSSPTTTANDAGNLNSGKCMTGTAASISR